MNDSSYRKALDDLKAERTQLAADREQIDRRIAQVEGAIANLSVVLDEGDSFEGGLADACRRVLMSAPGRVMVPTEVRDELKTFYDLNKHNNEMASIHSVLKRLVESGDVKPKRLSEGTGYYWGRSYPASPSQRDLQAFSRSVMESVQAASTMSETFKKAIDEATHISPQTLKHLREHEEETKRAAEKLTEIFGSAAWMDSKK